LAPGGIHCASKSGRGPDTLGAMADANRRINGD
jgi:hypothetical protein